MARRSLPIIMVPVSCVIQRKVQRLALRSPLTGSALLLIWTSDSFFVDPADTRNKWQCRDLSTTFSAVSLLALIKHRKECRSRMDRLRCPHSCWVVTERVSRCHINPGDMRGNLNGDDNGRRLRDQCSRTSIQTVAGSRFESYPPLAFSDLWRGQIIPTWLIID